MENFAHVQAMTVLAVGIIFGMGAREPPSASAFWAAAFWKAPPASPNSPRCCR